LFVLIFHAGDCRAIVSYELSRDELLFKMVGKSDGYVAVGLSPGNNLMGGDLTTACYYNPNNGEVRRTFVFNLQSNSVIMNSLIANPGCNEQIWPALAVRHKLV